MTTIKSRPNTTLLRLSIATLISFLLISAAILVSANNQIPIITNSHRLLQFSNGSLQSLPTNDSQYRVTPFPVSQFSDSQLPDSQLPDSKNRSSQNRPSKNRPVSASPHDPESAVTEVAIASQPASSITSASSTEQLSPEELKRRALSILRDLPDYYPSDSEFTAAVAQMNKRIEAQQLEVNVNTFLLSQHMSNDSRLAELQMQPFFAEFDHAVFSGRQRDKLDQEYQLVPQVKTTYSGVGFPHIENNNRSAANRYKPYKQLMSFSNDTADDVVPYVRCMGLSPERVAKRAKRYDAQITELAIKYKVSASLVKAVIAKESCFNPEARSHVGAIGLMQLMPATARWLKVKQPENPQQNLAGGVRYLAQLRKRFGGDELALAAYNAGPANVERYHGIPPFDETENYVVDVMHFYRGYAETTRYVNAQNGFYYP